MSFDISGVHNLTRDLGRASLRITGLASRVVAQTAKQIEASAKQRAPVDSGALRDSIGTDLYPLRAVVGPTVFWAQFQEWGTARSAPQPFVGPALDQHTEGYYSALESAAGRALD